MQIKARTLQPNTGDQHIIQRLKPLKHRLSASRTGSAPLRPLSRVLLRATLLLTLSLGFCAALVQVWADLRQEKDVVVSSAVEFLSSIAPSAEAAAYNFDDEAAEQVVEGLFTQGAISSVTIVNEGEVMISRSRDVVSTLPRLGAIGSPG